MTAWYVWPIGDNGLPAEDGRVREVHVVPEIERRRHRPQLCWCGPTKEMVDGCMRFTHRLQYGFAAPPT